MIAPHSIRDAHTRCQYQTVHAIRAYHHRLRDVSTPGLRQSWRACYLWKRAKRWRGCALSARTTGGAGGSIRYVSTGHRVASW
eukprot:2976759-Rhodomonas_salina.1